MVSRRKREEQDAEEVLQTRKAKEKILGETVSINYFQIPSSIKMALKQSSLYNIVTLLRFCSKTMKLRLVHSNDSN